ncbi:MAG: DUF4199 domain-containing protein [Flavobacteriales bacterium]|nr:DUF4199 domain-containing protein [Flavobacteriales bacterium]MCB9448587.1 DUF4199 domain-containing protein [Flavobacteriales bacterium]
MKSFGRIEFKWAVIFSVFSIAWVFFEKSMGWHDRLIDRHDSMTLLIVLPSALIYVLAMRDKRKRHTEREWGWLYAFRSGLGLTGFITLLTPLVGWFCLTYVSPDFFANMIHYMVNEQGQDPDDMERYFNMSAYITMFMVGRATLGIAGSALLAVWVRK